jgi:hypothetical protein
MGWLRNFFLCIPRTKYILSTSIVV